MCKHGRSVFRKSADNIWFKVDYYLAERNFIEEVKRQTCKCGLKVPAQVELHGIKVTLSLVFAKGYFTIMINVKVYLHRYERYRINHLLSHVRMSQR